MKTENLDRLYKVGGAAGKGFAYAYRYGIFDGMEFLDRIHATFRERFLEFQKVSPSAPGLAIDDYGHKWPDVLTCNFPPPAAFFNRRILESLAAHDIHPWKASPIPIGEILSSRLRSIPAPDYFVVEVESGISIDYSASGVEIDQTGNPRFPRGETILQFDPATWTGLEIFSCFNGLSGPTSILCTERVKRLAEKDGWTNVEFARQRIKDINPLAGLPGVRPETT